MPKYGMPGVAAGPRSARRVGVLVVVVLAVETPPDINMVPPARAEMIPTASFRMRVLIPLPV